MCVCHVTHIYRVNLYSWVLHVFHFFYNNVQIFAQAELAEFLYSILGQKIFSFLIFNELSQSLQQTSFLKMFVLLQTYICVYIFTVLISPSCLLYLGCIGNIADANRSFGIIKRRACLAFKITIDITEIDDAEIILL